MGFLATIVIGLIAGWLAGKVMKGGYGLIGDLVLGVIGGFVGGWLSSLILGVNLMSGIDLTSLITATLGAIVVIAISRLLTRRSIR